MVGVNEWLRGLVTAERIYIPSGSNVDSKYEVESYQEVTGRVARRVTEQLTGEVTGSDDARQYATLADGGAALPTGSGGARPPPRCVAGHSGGKVTNAASAGAAALPLVQRVMLAVSARVALLARITYHRIPRRAQPGDDKTADGDNDAAANDGRRWRRR